MHCTHTSVRHHVHVSIATCDVNGVDDNANTGRWLEKLAFDRLDSSVGNSILTPFSTCVQHIAGSTTRRVRRVADAYRVRNARRHVAHCARTAARASLVARDCGLPECCVACTHAADVLRHCLRRREDFCEFSRACRSSVAIVCARINTNS